MNTATQKSRAVSSGVENLIKRLRQDGIEQGREEANAIIADAKAKASAELAKARQEADAYYEERRREIETMRKSAEEELRALYSNTFLKIKEQLVRQFTRKIKSMITEATQDKSLLEKIILEVAGKQSAKAKVDNAKEVQLILPEKVMTLEALRQSKDKSKDSSLAQFISAATADMLREGVTLSVKDNIRGGIKVYLKNEKVEIDITDEALSELLMTHMQPRFRIILDEAVK